LSLLALPREALEINGNKELPQGLGGNPNIENNSVIAALPKPREARDFA
jgi:hypothetical protein